ncbi:unnamed protein product, partial [Effrenium voratum]
DSRAEALQSLLRRLLGASTFAAAAGGALGFPSAPLAAALGADAPRRGARRRRRAAHAAHRRGGGARVHQQRAVARGIHQVAACAASASGPTQGVPEDDGPQASELGREPGRAVLLPGAQAGRGRVRRGLRHVPPVPRREARGEDHPQEPVERVLRRRGGRGRHAGPGEPWPVARGWRIFQGAEYGGGGQAQHQGGLLGGALWQGLRPHKVRQGAPRRRQADHRRGRHGRHGPVRPHPPQGHHGQASEASSHDG